VHNLVLVIFFFEELKNNKYDVCYEEDIVQIYSVKLFYIINIFFYLILFIFSYKTFEIYFILLVQKIIRCYQLYHSINLLLLLKSKLWLRH